MGASLNRGFMSEQGLYDKEVVMSSPGFVKKKRDF